MYKKQKEVKFKIVWIKKIYKNVRGCTLAENIKCLKENA